MYYHATPLSNLKSIMRGGLKPVDGKIYVATYGQEARNFAEDVVMGLGRHSERPKKWAMLGISLEGLVLTDFQRDPDSDVGSYYILTSRPIPPSHIKLLGTFEVG